MDKTWTGHLSEQGNFLAPALPGPNELVEQFLAVNTSVFKCFHLVTIPLGHVGGVETPIGRCRDTAIGGRWDTYMRDSWSER